MVNKKFREPFLHMNRKKIIINQDYPNNLEGPFDSVVEREFAEEICKFLKSGVSIETQINLNTTLGNFRGDLGIEFKGLRIVLEIDGKDFHSKSRDIWRDAFIMGENLTDVIIRFTGKDIVYNINECLYILFLLYPSIFSSRATKNLPTLIDDENKEVIGQNISRNFFDFLDEINFEITYPDTVLDRINTRIKLTIHKQPKGYWSQYYNFGKLKENPTIESLNEAYFGT